MRDRGTSSTTRSRLTRFLRPPAFDDPDDAYVARLVHLISIALGTFSVALTVNTLVRGSETATFYGAVAVFACAAIFVLLHRRRLRIASHLLPTLYLLLMSLHVATAHGLHDMGMIGFPLAIVLAGLLLGERALFVYAGLTIGALAAVYLLEVQGLIPGAFAGATDVSDIINVALILLITTLLLYLMVTNLKASLKLSRRQAAERQQLVAELEARNVELERFAYAVSHDLKTPLVTIGTFVGSLVPSAEQGDLDRLRRDADRVTLAAAEMSRLLDELLEASPPEGAPHGEAFDRRSGRPGPASPSATGRPGFGNRSRPCAAGTAEHGHGSPVITCPLDRKRNRRRTR